MHRQVTAVGGISFAVRSDSNAAFWGLVEDEAWESETLRAIRLLTGPGVVFVDVGAWIGPTALFAAAAGSNVIAFEPDPVAFDRLSKNLALNPDLVPQVTAVQAAAAGAAGSATLYAEKLGRSLTSIYPDPQGLAQTCISAEAVDLIAIIEQLVPEAAKIVVKIDIEGGEFELVPAVAEGLVRLGASVLLSTHPQNIVRGSAFETALERYRAKLNIFAALRSLRFHEMHEDKLRPLDSKAVLRGAMAKPSSPDFLIAIPGD